MQNNILTIDVEDWHQLAHRKLLGRAVPASQKLVDQTYLILKMLAEHNARATFFVVGAVAEQFPELVRRIQSEGHEVGSHGYSHRPTTSMGPEQFADDLTRSLRVLEDITREPVVSYRAADFSLNGTTPLALETLTACGLRYDSSTFPILHAVYGMPRAPRFPHRVETAGGPLWQFPLATVRLLGQNIPIAGGGYLRVLPVSLVKWGIRKLNQQGHVAVIYLHPYDLEEEWLDLPVAGQSPLKRVRLRLRALKRNWGHGRSFRAKLEALLDSFSFVPLREVVPTDEAPRESPDVLPEARPTV